MKLLAMDSKAISTATSWATKYSFVSPIDANRKEVSKFLRTRTNTAPPLLSPIGDATLLTLMNWNKGCSGINLTRLASVGGYYPLFFDRIIYQLM